MHPHGAKTLSNLYSSPSLFSQTPQNNIPPINFLSNCEVMDQEPIDLSYIKHATTVYETRKDNHIIEHRGLDSMSFQLYNSVPEITNPLFVFSSAVNMPLVCHSEKNSNDVNILKSNFYIDVYYWVHAFYALEWFSAYKYLSKTYNNNSKKFGLYARDMSGTRTYRYNILQNLSTINTSVHYKLHPPVINFLIKQNAIDLLSKWECTEFIDSNNSAIIDWDDHSLFDIHIVCETLFNTNKTHLTEKIFKPIVMHQPFILFAGPHSLQYLRDYGFKTFGHIWDESYDLETDASTRYEKIINVIHYINNLSKTEYDILIKKTQPIILHNHNHFYSQTFEDITISELRTNFNMGINTQQEQFYSMPGGTLFHYYNILYKNKTEMYEVHKMRFTTLLSYLQIYYPSIYKSIKYKYSKLLDMI